MIESISIRHYSSPFGELILGAYGDQLCLCDWKYRKQRDSIDRRIKDYLDLEFIERDAPVTEEAIAQLEAYFRREARGFDLPLLLAGSAFQQRVWNALRGIPYGKTESYTALSARLGDPLAIRAVAAANGANALAIIIPCHRILGSDGSMTGYAGGTRIKKKLLQLEGALGQQELDF